MDLNCIAHGRRHAVPTVGLYNHGISDRCRRPCRYVYHCNVRRWWQRVRFAVPPRVDSCHDAVQLVRYTQKVMQKKMDQPLMLQVGCDTA